MPTETITPEEYHRLTKRRKYGNEPARVDGYTFDSQAEARHYRDLRAAELGGAISDLRIKTRYPLIVNGVECGYYEDDFNFLHDGERVIVDVKSAATRTPLYRLKKRIVEALYGVRISEVEA